MLIKDIIDVLESVANPSLQEGYDNAGLLTGHRDWECKGITCSLDATEEVVNEAVAKGNNLIVAHHPIIFSGLKRINGYNYVERTIIAAIKHDIAIYAIHTNLDNVLEGVSGRMADRLSLKNQVILSVKKDTLRKLVSFVPEEKAEEVRNAIFAAGAGHIGQYSECSFNSEGLGTFMAGEGANPFVGEIGRQHQEKEIKIEAVFPSHLQGRVVAALKAAHPYEEVAFDVLHLANGHPGIGSGLIGEFDRNLTESEFLSHLKATFGLTALRHTALLGKTVRRVAVCGGSGSFLIANALAAGVDAYVTADLKYHEFFDAEARMLLVDIGHYESEQFTIDLLQEILLQKFPTFAVLKTAVLTNPVRYS